MILVKVIVTIYKVHYPCFTKGLGSLCKSVSYMMPLSRAIGKATRGYLDGLLYFCTCISDATTFSGIKPK